MTERPARSDADWRWLIFGLLLACTLLVYMPRLNAIDAEAILGVSTSLVRRGSTDINVIGASDALLPFDKARMGSFGVDGALYSKKGLTPSLLLLPLVGLAEVAPWLDARATAMLLNPLLTALAGALLYTLIRWPGYSQRTSLITALLFGLACLPFPYAKTLYGEPAAMVLLLLAVMGAQRFCQRKETHWLMLGSVALGLLIGINMVYALAVPLIGLYALGAGLSARRLLILGGPIALALGIIGLYNAMRFGSPLDTGYAFATGEGFRTPLLTGLIGLTVSPFRGLLWYSPILLLAGPGWWLMRRRERGLAWLTLALVASVLIAFALWSSWEGGVVWGPRFLLPITSLLALWLAPMVEAAWEQRGLRLGLIGLGLISAGVQLLGALISVYPFFGEVYERFYSVQADIFSDAVLYDPASSAVLGHLRMLLNGTALEPAWLARGVDPIHLLAALSVGVTAWLALRGGRWHWLAAGVMLVSLNVIAARQQSSEDSRAVRELSEAMEPAAPVFAATTAFGESLLDLEGREPAYSSNAPTDPTDPLALPMWADALIHSRALWLVTWFPPADARNWQERELWERGSFVAERKASGHRLLLFSLEEAPEASRVAGQRFGSILLERYGTTEGADGLLVTLEWRAADAPGADLSWFVHVIGPDGATLAQQDRAPMGGYAPTSQWRAGEAVQDRLFFPGVSGDGLRLRVGWVDPTSRERLPAFGPEGTALAEGYALLAVGS